MHYLAKAQLLTSWQNMIQQGGKTENKHGHEEEEDLPIHREEYLKRIAAIIQQRKLTLNPMMPVFFDYMDDPLKLKYARQCYLYQETGQKNLDCINNVSHIGHCHPQFVRRMRKQMGILLTNSRFLYDQLTICTQKLLKKFPPQLSKVSYINSGSEANDIALQMARWHTGKRGILCLNWAYHGMTSAVLDVSPHQWTSSYKKPDHVTIAHTPDTYRGYLRNSQNPAEEYAKYIESILDDNIGAFICEFMQCCGGQVIPPKDVFIKVYEVLRNRGIVCIGDEVQTGFGRIGTHFWSFEYYGVIPDIVTVGKPMGNGFPVSAVICTPEMAESYRHHGEYFSTFGGNPLAVTAAMCVLDVIESDKIQQNAHQTGLYLRQKLLPFVDKYPFVGDVRGMGLFQGVDLVKDKETRQQDGDLAFQVIRRLRTKKVVLNRDGPKGNVLKFKPPCIFNKGHADQLIAKLELVLDQLYEQIKAKKN